MSKKNAILKLESVEKDLDTLTIKRSALTEDLDALMIARAKSYVYAFTYYDKIEKFDLINGRVILLRDNWREWGVFTRDRAISEDISRRVKSLEGEIDTLEVRRDILADRIISQKKLDELVATRAKKFLELPHLKNILGKNSKISEKIFKIENEIEKKISGAEKIKKVIGSAEKNLVKILEKQKQINEIKNITAIYTSELKFLNQYQKCVDKKRGISQKILANLCGVLTRECNMILSDIAEFEMLLDVENDKIRIYTYSPVGNVKNIAKIPASMASGYQKFVMDMILRIVLTTAFSGRGNLSNPEILIIDEGFGCLDKKNFVEVAKTLKKLRTRFKAILVITHIDELKTYADDLMNITRVSGESKLTYGRNSADDSAVESMLKMTLVDDINAKKEKMEKMRADINVKQAKKKADIEAKKAEKKRIQDEKDAERKRIKAEKATAKANEVAKKQRLEGIMASSDLVKDQIIEEYTDDDGVSVFKCKACDKEYLARSNGINKHVVGSTYKAKHKKYIYTQL